MASNIPVPPATSAPIINPILGAHITAPAANATPISRSPRSPTDPHRPAAALEDPKDVTTAAFVLKDGTSFQGISFGSETKSISGECVFQTGKFYWVERESVCVIGVLGRI
jgi:carbamoyl-phosphate synthase/aspartate carbamoyltransferase